MKKPKKGIKISGRATGNGGKKEGRGGTSKMVSRKNGKKTWRFIAIKVGKLWGKPKEKNGNPLM